jgi:thiamine kinase-like enzyme
MIADRIHIQKIQSLDYWSGPIEIEPLPGGITNRNFVVADAGRRYVARLCQDRALLGIDRRNEVVCQRAAHACGIAPEVVHHENGVLISRHLEGRALAPADLRDPQVLGRLAAVLRTLHESWDRLTGEILYFSAFQTVRTYAQTARALNARLPDDLADRLEDAARLSRTIAPFHPVLCHNDLLAANMIDNGRNLWLVDWEYAGVGHPLFDLAGVSANAALPEALDAALLAAYRGSVDVRDLRELKILKTMSLLREALWAAIQTVTSDIAFDYGRYARDNFAAYREAWERL